MKIVLGGIVMFMLFSLWCVLKASSRAEHITIKNKEIDN